jgi:hypothetical protein
MPIRGSCELTRFQALQAAFGTARNRLQRRALRCTMTGARSMRVSGHGHRSGIAMG